MSRYLTAKSMGAGITLPTKVQELIERLSFFDKNTLNGYRPKLAALDKGYFNHVSEK